MNRKVRNATPRTYDNIKFKSMLEVMTYKTLKESGFTPEYEQHTFLIWKGFVPQIPFFTRNRFKAKNRNIEKVSDATCRDCRSVHDITFTPDFIFDCDGTTVIVECKGKANDIFPYKFKMFRKYLEETKDIIDYEIWEIFTKKQLLECIQHLKKRQKT